MIGAKPFDIPKQEVWDAFKRVTANQGTAGVDGQSIQDFEARLGDNLYKLWNRLSPGSYMPPPVRRVDMPRLAKWKGGLFGVSYLPAVSAKALKAVRQTIRGWTLRTRSDKMVDDLAQMFNPHIRGWINCYSHFYKSALYPALRRIDAFLLRWARRKPSAISRWCRSTNAGRATRGFPISMPTQATGSSIHAATSVTTPRATSIWAAPPFARRSLYCHRTRRP